ncbi:hypothetical protein [uncultured Mediterranean phage uvDeep-CGR2-KM18-C74]|nr:hypothetical protein [uncultured Mediterranean phage uvDeep-CGR2-KM18-C74]
MVSIKSNQWMSVADAAKSLGIGEKTMRETIKTSPFPHYHFGGTRDSHGKRIGGVIRIPIPQLSEFTENRWNKRERGVQYGDGPPLCRECNGDERIFEFVPQSVPVNS